MAYLGGDKAGGMTGRLIAIVAVGLLVSMPAWGRPQNGNDFSLDLALAKTPAATKRVIDEALGKQHFFRYLHITGLEEGETNGYPYVDLVTYEPSSKWRVVFKVQKSLSLAVLKQDPASKVGDDLAVTGTVKSVNPAAREIVLNPVIVRYKDRNGPKSSELYHERDTSGVIYSFTGGKEAVNVSLRDKDLLQYEQKMLTERGKDGWAQFLITEIAKRDKAAKANRDQLGIYRKQAPVTGAQDKPVAAPGVITEDEE